MKRAGLRNDAISTADDWACYLSVLHEDFISYNAFSVTEVVGCVTLYQVDDVGCVTMLINCEGCW